MRTFLSIVVLIETSYVVSLKRKEIWAFAKPYLSEAWNWLKGKVVKTKKS